MKSGNNLEIHKINLIDDNVFIKDNMSEVKWHK